MFEKINVTVIIINNKNFAENYTLLQIWNSISE